MNMKEKLLQIEGLRIWGEDLGKARIYINDDTHFEQVFGFKVERYNTGNIKRAYINGELISNSEAKRIKIKHNLNKVYFDIELNKFVGTDLDAII